LRQIHKDYLRNHSDLRGNSTLQRKVIRAYFDWFFFDIESQSWVRAKEYLEPFIPDGESLSPWIDNYKLLSDGNVLFFTQKEDDSDNLYPYLLNFY